MLSPAREATNPIRIEMNIIFLKSLTNKLAVAWGIVNKDIIRMIPTTFILRTIVSATKLIRT